MGKKTNINKMFLNRPLFWGNPDNSHNILRSPEKYCVMHSQAYFRTPSTTMMELFGSLISLQHLFFISNKYFVDNFGDINVKLECKTFLVLLLLMWNIPLFLWRKNTVTYLKENNIDERAAGRLAILNVDLHSTRFPSIL